MPEFYLVRHAQASFGAKNYDKLSALGHQQSEWLGEYFKQRHIYFDRILIGELVRHRETADSLCKAFEQIPPIETHPGLNEFAFQRIAASYAHRHPEALPRENATPQDSYKLLKYAMRAWINGELPSSELPESWSEFEQRVNHVLHHIRLNCHEPAEKHNNDASTKPHQRLLVISSGGAIATMLKHVLGFHNDTLVNLNLQMKNTGISHFFYNQEDIRLSSFNHVPHLDIKERLESVTYH